MIMVSLIINNSSEKDLQDEYIVEYNIEKPNFLLLNPKC